MRRVRQLRFREHFVRHFECVDEERADLDPMRRGFVGVALVAAHQKFTARQINHFDPGLRDDFDGATFGLGIAGGTFQLFPTLGLWRRFLATG
jgi:hypothetical protein